MALRGKGGRCVGTAHAISYVCDTLCQETCRVLSLQDHKELDSEKFRNGLNNGKNIKHKK